MITSPLSEHFSDEVEAFHMIGLVAHIRSFFVSRTEVELDAEAVRQTLLLCINSLSIMQMDSQSSELLAKFANNLK